MIACLSCVFFFVFTYPGKRMGLGVNSWVVVGGGVTPRPGGLAGPNSITVTMG